MRKYVVIIVAAWLALSCEEIMRIEFEGNGTRKLVVEGMITTDTTAHAVILSYSGDYFAPQNPAMATGAKVTISDSDTVFHLHEVYPGCYYTDSGVYGKAGAEYTLKIITSDGQQYTATEKLLPCAEIDSIVQSPNYDYFGNGYGYDVLYFGYEPEPAGDYYLYRIYLNDSLLTDSLPELPFVSDEFVNGNYIHDFTIYRIREEDVKNPFARIRVELYSIPASYYEFITAVLLETEWRGSPWDGPPANAAGNISNGGLGYFVASDVRRAVRDFYPLPRTN